MPRPGGPPRARRRCAGRDSPVPAPCRGGGAGQASGRGRGAAGELGGPWLALYRVGPASAMIPPGSGLVRVSIPAGAARLAMQEPASGGVMRSRLASDRRRTACHDRSDHLHSSRRHFARAGQEPDAHLWVLPPNDLTRGFHAVELHNELEAIRHVGRSIQLKARPGFGKIADRARQGRMTLIEGDNAAFQDAASCNAAPVSLLLVLNISHHGGAVSALARPSSASRKTRANPSWSLVNVERRRSNGLGARMFPLIPVMRNKSNGR